MKNIGFIIVTRTLFFFLLASSFFNCTNTRSKRANGSNIINQETYNGFAVSDFCRSLSAGNRILEEEDWNVWCFSPIWGEDGKVHAFLSRWRDDNFHNWLTESEIAHAVADHPEGPYTVTRTVLTGRGEGFWDAHTIHNPTVYKVGDKYALFYIGNNLTLAEQNNAHHASTQRVGLAIADSLTGEWRRVSDELRILDTSPDKSEWDSYLTTNPALLLHPNGEYWLYYKAWDRNNDNLRKMGLAIAQNIEGPYVKHPDNPLVDFSHLNRQVEDAYVFFYNNKFYMVMRDMGVIHPHVGLLLESDDGITWSEPMLGYHNNAYYFGGDIKRFERPQVLMKDGVPTHLFLSLMGGKYNTSSAAVLKIDASKLK